MQVPARRDAALGCAAIAKAGYNLSSDKGHLPKNAEYCACEMRSCGSRACQRVHLRKLAAILAADIAGYRALMGSDKERTVRAAGDGILAEFSSAAKAVECAVTIQQKMAERNAKIEPERRMRFDAAPRRPVSDEDIGSLSQ